MERDAAHRRLTCCRPVSPIVSCDRRGEGNGHRFATERSIMITAGELTFEAVNGKSLSVYTTRDDDGVPQGLQISGPLAFVTHRGPHADNLFSVELGFRMELDRPFVTIQVAPGTPVELNR